MPIAQSWKPLTVENEESDPKSTLHLYRSALTLRKQYMNSRGGITWINSPAHGEKIEKVLSYTRGPITAILNLSDKPYECSISGKPLIVSNGVIDAYSGKKVIPARSCAWFIS